MTDNRRVPLGSYVAERDKITRGNRRRNWSNGLRYRISLVLITLILGELGFHAFRWPFEANPFLDALFFGLVVTLLLTGLHYLEQEVF